MALVHLNVNSKYLSGNTDVNIVLPDLPRGVSPQEFYMSGKKYPVMWLLHGTFNDYSQWVRMTNVELYAEEKNLIVVMPTAHNTDYANWPGFGTGYNMFDYVTEELMPLIYGWFPASQAREDNFIAGLSMGGRGAIMFAYEYPEKFAAVYSMSCVPQDIRPAAEDAMSDEPPANPWAALDRARTMARLNNTGGLEGYLDGPQNTWDKTAEVAKREGNPKMYFTCGTKDFVMYKHFVKFRKYAEELGLDAEFTEVEGFNHEWRFWDMCVQDAINKFLPGDDKAGNAF